MNVKMKKFKQARVNGGIIYAQDALAEAIEEIILPIPYDSRP